MHFYWFFPVANGYNDRLKGKRTAHQPLTQNEKVMKMSHCSFVCLIIYLATVNLATSDVDIPDPNLRDYIVQLLGLPTDAPITTDDMKRLGGLSPNGLGIKDLTGLETATNLEWIQAFENQITDISPVTGLDKLKAINFQDNQITDISPISVMNGLERIRIGNNRIRDISPLKSLTNLRYLHLSQNDLEIYLLYKVCQT